MDLLGLEWDFEYQKRATGRDLFVRWPNVEVSTLPGTVLAILYLDHLPRWAIYEICCLFMEPTPPVVSYYSDLVFRHQPGQGPVWSIAGIAIPALIAFWVLGACPSGIIGFTYHEVSICRNGHGFLVSLALKSCERVGEVGFSWFLEGPSFFLSVWLSLSQDLLRLIAQALAYKINDFRYFGKPLSFSTYPKAVLREHSLDSPVCLICRALPASTVHFAVDQRFSMHETHVKTFWSDGVLGLASGAMSADLCDDECTSYPDDGDDDDWDFADVSDDSHVDVPFSICQDFGAIRMLCR